MHQSKAKVEDEREKLNNKLNKVKNQLTEARSNQAIAESTAVEVTERNKTVEATTEEYETALKLKVALLMNFQCQNYTQKCRD